MDRLHQWALVVFAAMLGLFEGPAEIACAAVLVTTALTGGFRKWRPGVIELAVIVWVLVCVMVLVSVVGVVLLVPVAVVVLVSVLVVVVTVMGIRVVCGGSVG